MALYTFAPGQLVPILPSEPRRLPPVAGQIMIWVPADYFLPNPPAGTTVALRLSTTVETAPRTARGYTTGLSLFLSVCVCVRTSLYLCISARFANACLSHLLDPRYYW